MGVKVCRDCATCGAVRNPRPAPFPGPRCATHHGAVVKARKRAAHEAMVIRVYGLAPGDYDRLYEAQGGRCAICRRATGATKALAVDHDHRTGLARLLACGPCNKIIGHFRDDPDLLRTAAAALENPTARRLGIVAIHQDNRGG